MRAAHLALGITTQHARNLVHPTRSLEHRDVGGSNTTFRALRDHDVVVSSRGDLRQMGDGEYLVLLRNAAQSVSHLEPDATADARIDLVEDKSRHTIYPSENR